MLLNRKNSGAKPLTYRGSTISVHAGTSASTHSVFFPSILTREKMSETLSNMYMMWVNGKEVIGHAEQSVSNTPHPDIISC
jgi:hypothetical protein